MGQKRPKIPKSVTDQVMQEGNYSCVYCGGQAEVIDHIFPWAFEQTHRQENLVAACAVCNGIASDKNFDRFIDKLEYVRRERERRGLTPLYGGKQLEAPAKRIIKKIEVADGDDRPRKKGRIRPMLTYDPPPPKMRSSATITNKLIELLVTKEGLSKNQAAKAIGELVGLHPKTVTMISNNRPCGKQTYEKLRRLFEMNTRTWRLELKKLVEMYEEEGGGQPLLAKDITKMANLRAALGPSNLAHYLKGGRATPRITFAVKELFRQKRPSRRQEKFRVFVPMRSDEDRAAAMTLTPEERRIAILEAVKSKSTRKRNR